MTHYDYIAIGAGSAGCVVANRLTEDPETTVLLLEAGNPDTKPEIHIPLDATRLPGTEVDWGYFSEPEPYLNDRKIFCPRGKVLGGSSAINFLVYTRGNPHDYDRWQSLGNPGWSYQDSQKRSINHFEVELAHGSDRTVIARSK
jgi:choline dehydrogenase